MSTGSSRWFYMDGDARQGPVTSSELRSLARAGLIGAETLVWKSGLPDWVEARRVRGLLPEQVEGDEPPPPPTRAPQPQVAPNPPRRIDVSSAPPPPAPSGNLFHESQSNGDGFEDLAAEACTGEVAQGSRKAGATPPRRSLIRSLRAAAAAGLLLAFGVLWLCLSFHVVYDGTDIEIISKREAAFEDTFVELDELVERYNRRSDIEAVTARARGKLNFDALISQLQRRGLIRDAVVLGSEPGDVDASTTRLDNDEASRSPQPAREVSSPSRNTAPIRAIGVAEIAAALRDKGDQIRESRDPKGQTLLHRANCVSTAEVVLAAGGDVSAKDNEGLTPLHVQPDSAVIKVLIEAGANLEATSSDGRTPLHVAAKEGSLSRVETLLKAGAKVDARDQLGRTPLHLTDRAPIAEALIQSGADVNATDSSGGTPIQNATHTKFAQVLLAAGARVDGKPAGWTPLHSAAARGDEKEVAALARDRASIAAGPSTPLHFARTARIATLLIEAGAKADAADALGRTPIFSAADAEIVAVLLGAGAKVDATDKERRTPLQVVCSDRRFGVDVVEALLRAGADIDRSLAFDGYWTALTPIQSASAADDAEVVRLLLRAGADPNDKNLRDQTPLSLTRSAEVAQLLIAAGAKVESSLLRSAMSSEVLALVIAAGVDVRSANNRGLTPLHFATSLDQAMALVGAGADVRAKTETSDFQKRMDLEQIRAGNLFGASASVTEGREPLHEAARKGDPVLIQYYLLLGADARAKDADGKTPHADARPENRDLLWDAMMDAGAK